MKRRRHAKAVAPSHRCGKGRDNRAVSVGAPLATSPHPTKKCVRHGERFAGQSPTVTKTARQRALQEFPSPHLPFSGKEIRRGSSSGVAKTKARPTVAPASAWEFHELLSSKLKARGFACGSFLALRVMTEGTEAALQVVLLAFYAALQEAQEDWRVRHNTKPPFRLQAQ